MNIFTSTHRIVDIKNRHFI